MKRLLLVISLVTTFFCAKATTYEVTSLADDGDGSIRAALLSSYENQEPFGFSEADTILLKVEGTIMLDTTLEMKSIAQIYGLGTGKTILDGSRFNGPVIIISSGGFGQDGPGEEAPVEDVNSVPSARPLATFGASVENLTIQNSYSATVGGAGEVGYSASVTFFNVLFLNNSAEYFGGGVYVNDDSYTTFDSCLFENNSSITQGGGAIGSQGYYSNITVQNSEFINNSAATSGGALFGEGDGVNFTLSNNSFKLNFAKDGGAIYLGGSYSYNTFSELTFEKNNALSGNGGAISIGSYDVNMDITSSVFLENTASNDAGAIYLNSNNGGVSLTEVLLEKNKALAGNGGAISVGVNSMNLDIRSSTFLENSAVSGGVIFCNVGSNSTFTNSTLTQNIAQNEGGAVYYHDGELVLRFTTVFGNTASNGAGIHVGSLSRTTLDKTVIAGNMPLTDDVVYDEGESSFNMSGYSFIGATNASLNLSVGDTVGASAAPIDPLLADLADNGGFTLTHEPLPGSPLIDRIPGSSIIETNDQRGGIYVRVNNTNADVGAVEYQCDHVVDLTTDGNECGTLREAIEYSNSNDGTDVIAFNLPQGSIIELMDSISITDQVYMYAHVYDFDNDVLVNDSRIGIKAATAGIDGLVLSGDASFTEIVNFNFQGFDGAAIKISNTYAIYIGGNSFGSTLADSTIAGVANNVGISVEGAGDVFIGERGFNNAPFTYNVTDNWFTGNNIGVFSDGLSEDIVIVVKDVFSCNGIGIKNQTPEPVIDTVFGGYIKGHAEAFDHIEIYAADKCNEDQGLIYIGEVYADSDGEFESFSFNFDTSFSYVATREPFAGEGYGSTSPFSLPVTVTPCDSIASIADFEICGDSLLYKLETIPVGYQLGISDVTEIARTTISNDTLIIEGLTNDTASFSLELYNNMSCTYYDDFLVVKYDEPSVANITTFTYPMCDDSLKVDASVPTIGQGYWSTPSALTFDDAANISTVVRNINEGDSLTVLWTVENGVCPISMDSIVVQRDFYLTPEVSLSASVPVCSDDTIHFEADFNYDYDPMDYFSWYVNGVLDNNAYDSLYSKPNLKSGDTINVVYASFAVNCQTKSDDTAQVILSIPQQTLTAVDDNESITILNSNSFNVVNNDVVLNQDITGLVVLGGVATVEGDTALLYNGFTQGIDTIEYAILSSCGGVDTALLIIDVINTAPEAHDTLFSVLSGSSVFLNVDDLFTDAENNFDPFSGRLVNQTTSPAQITFMSGTIDVDYSSDISYNGVDTIWVEASDYALDKDTVRIIFQVSDTITARAGDDQTITVPNAMLNANAVAGYTTYWITNSTTVTFDDINLANATISGLTPEDSPYELIWNISNGVEIKSDTVLITVQNSAPISSDFMITIKPSTDTLLNILDLFVDAESNIDTATLVIESKSNANALVSILNDSLSLSYASLSSYTGIDTVFVSLSDVFGEKGVAEFIIDVNENIPVSAGDDQIITTPSTTLEGNTLNGYVTYWSSSSADVSFADPSDALTVVSGLSPLNSPYELVWNISNGANIVSDTVFITVINTAPLAEDLSITLKPGADTVVHGRGLFTDAEDNVDSRTLVNIVSQSNSNATVSIVNDSLYVSYSSAQLYIGVDTVLVSLADVFGEIGIATIVIDVTEKLKPYAGIDFTIDTTVATLGATPVAGSYTSLWTSVKSGITFDDPTSATTEARGFSPKEKSYLLIWTISNGIDSESDTVKVEVENVAPVITSVDVVVTEEVEVIPANNLIRDRNDNLADTIRIITPFSYLPESVVEIDIEALTITIDLTKQKRYNKSQGITDSLQYEICDEEGLCDRSYIKVVRLEEKPIELVIEELSNVGIGTSFNFMSPNGDGINETFFFNLVLDDGESGEPWFFVDEDQKDGELKAGEVYEAIFETLISKIEISIINRWGDEVASYENYFGGTETKNGEIFPDETVWKGKDKNGDFVTPGTYYYYIILHARKGEDAKIGGFIEVRN